MTDQSIFSQPTVQITNEVEIDDMLLVIAAADEQIAQYKALKAHRTKPIDDEIEKLEEKKEMYRTAIKQFMMETQEKALKYPGVGKISFRTAKGKWRVIDEAKLLKELINKLNQTDHDRIVQYIPKINKTELNKILDSWEASDEMPEAVVEREEDASSITITLDKTEALEDKVHQKRSEVLSSDHTPKLLPPKAAHDGFDGLDF